MPRTGELNKYVQIEERVKFVDDQGGVSFRWVQTQLVSAKVRGIDYSQRLSSSQISFTQAYEIYIRNSENIEISAKENRLIYKEKELTIHSLVDIHEMGMYYKILAYTKL